jgi:diacylglycerol kinase (ATP)
MGFWRARLVSFRYAWRGIVALLLGKGNARVHLAATIAVVIAGLLLRISGGEWCLLALACGLVWVAEGLNTAVEVLANRISVERDEQIGLAKDLAAGAVLLAAIAAVTVGAFIFGPRIAGLF